MRNIYFLKDNNLKLHKIIDFIFNGKNGIGLYKSIYLFIFLLKNKNLIGTCFVNII